MIPGQLIPKSTSEPLKANVGLETLELSVSNVGDRPIQIGSHFNFYEVNEALKYDRPLAKGFRLNIAAGTAIRFEPGDTKRVELVALAGRRQVFGLNNLVDGDL